MKIAYVTLFYNGSCDGRYGRFHDWVHALRDMNDPLFDFDVHAFMASNEDGTLSSPPLALLGDGESLWASKRNNVERLLNAPRIYRDLARTDADIVHLIAFDPIALSTVSTALDDTPLVIGPNIGGWYPNRADEVWKAGPIHNAKLRAGFALRRALVDYFEFDRAVAFSEYHKRMLALLDIPGDECLTLHPGVDGRFSLPETSAPPAGVPEILYVGDLSEHKGYPLFLRAIAGLERDVRARVIGSGNPRRTLVRSLGLREEVSIEGFVDRANLPPYYQSADLLVVPSIDETAGTNTQFEALACGTPVVTTNAPGLNEFAPDDAVVRFWPREPEVLTEAIGTALDDLTNLSAAARIQSDRFSADRTVKQLSQFYERLMA